MLFKNLHHNIFAGTSGHLPPTLSSLTRALPVSLRKEGWIWEVAL